MTTFADPMPTPYDGGGGDVSRSATVQLDANTSGYQQQMRAAQAATAQLTQGVTQLSFHVDNLFKAAGKGLKIISAGDVALMTSAVASAASFQQQMGTLSATAAVTGKSMSTFSSAVNNAFVKFPQSRGEIVQMVQSLAGLSVGSKYIGQITQEAIKLETALGEQGVGAALVQLDRTMGVTQARFGNMANSLLTLAKNAGVSGGGIAQQAQMIAPISRMAGMRPGQILGAATAMQRSGASAGTAASMWNSMLTDMMTMARTGDPNLTQYSSFMGMSQGQLTRMINRGQAGQAMGAIFRQLSRGGAPALNFVNQMGWGPRGISAAQALSNAQLQRMMTMGQGATANQANLNKGFQAATNNLVDSMSKLHNQVTMLVEQLGAPLLGPLTAFAKAMSSVVGVISKIAGAPVIHQMLTAAGVAAPLGLGAGALVLRHLPMIMGMATINLLRKTGLGVAFREGRAQAAGALAPGEALIGSQIAAAGGIGAAVRGGGINARAAGAYMMGQRFGGWFGAAPAAGAGGPGMIRRGLAYGLRGIGLGGAWAYNMQAQTLRDARLEGYARSAYAGTGLGTGQAAAEQASIRARIAAEKMTTDQLLANAGLLGVAKQSIRDLTRAGFRYASEAGKTGAALAGGALWGGVKGFGRGLRGMAGRALFGPSMPSFEAQRAAELKVQEADARLATAMEAQAAAVGKGTAAMTKANEAYVKAVLDVDAALVEQAAVARASAKRGLISGGPGGAGVLGGMLGIGRGRGYGMGVGMTAMLASTFLPGTLGRVAGGVGTGAMIGSMIPIPGATVAGMAIGGLTSWLTRPKAPPKPDPALEAAKRAVPSQAQAVQNAMAMTGSVKSPAVKAIIMGYARKEGMVADAKKAGVSEDDLYKALTGQRISTQQVPAPGIVPSGAAMPMGPGAGYGSATQVMGESMSPALALVQRWATQGGSDRHLQETRLLEGAVKRGARQWATAGAQPMTPLGSFLASSRAFQAVTTGKLTGAPGPQQAAIEQASAAALKFAGNTTQAVVQLEKLANASGGATAAIEQGSAQWARMFDDANMQYKSKAQQLAILAQRVTAERPMATGPHAKPEAQKLYTGDVQALLAGKSDYNQSLIQQYQAARDFGIQMTRMYQQYYTTRDRQQRDFHRSQARAEQDYNLSRAREIRDFNRQELYAAQDYNTQVFRTTQDFHTQMKREAEQAAQSIYNPFQEVQAQEVAGAGMTLYNLRDQNRRIFQQIAQLRQARKMGLSTQAIKELNLADPQNAQQLNAIVQQLGTPGMAWQINQAVAIRVKGTTRLTQNTLNTEFANTIQDFHRGLARMKADYDRTHQRALDQQHTALTDMAHDYHVNTRRMVADENTALQDMAFDFHRTVNQTVGDMTRQMTELYGSFAVNTTKAIQEINRTFGKYAPQLARTLTAQIAVAESAIQSAATTSYGQPGMPVGPGLGGQMGQVTAGSTGVGSTRAQRTVANALVGAGVSAAGVAGIMGNIAQESGFNPLAGRGTAHQGIGQWGGSRWAALQAFARSSGSSAYDLNTQIAFMIREARARGDLSAASQAGSAMAAAASWNQRFEGSGEKPGDPGYANRMRYAQAWARSARYQTVGGIGRSPVGRGLRRGRTDQGVDWSGSGPIYAVGNGRIALAIPNDPGWLGSYMVLKLDNPPSRDRQFVYYAEGIHQTVRQGQRVRAGQVIGHAYGGSSGIEIGWAAGASQTTQARAHNQQAPGSDPGARPSGYGRNFARWITGHQRGGISQHEHLARIAEHNMPEAVIPLDNRGHQFLRNMYAKIAEDLRRLAHHRPRGVTTADVGALRQREQQLGQALQHIHIHHHLTADQRWVAHVRQQERKALEPIRHREHILALRENTLEHKLANKHLSKIAREGLETREKGVERRLDALRARDDRVRQQFEHKIWWHHASAEQRYEYTVHEHMRQRLHPLQRQEESLDNRIRRVAHRLAHDRLTMHERHLLEKREKNLKKEEKNVEKRETHVRNEAAQTIHRHRERIWERGQEQQYQQAHRRQTQQYTAGILGRIGYDAGQDLANVYFGQATKRDKDRYKQFQKNVADLHELQQEARQHRARHATHNHHGGTHHHHHHGGQHHHHGPGFTLAELHAISRRREEARERAGAAAARTELAKMHQYNLGASPQLRATEMRHLRERSMHLAVEMHAPYVRHHAAQQHHMETQLHQLILHLHAAQRGLPGQQHGHATYNQDYRTQFQIHQMNIAAADAAKIQRELDQLARLKKLTAPAHH